MSSSIGLYSKLKINMTSQTNKSIRTNVTATLNLNMILTLINLIKNIDSL